MSYECDLLSYGPDNQFVITVSTLSTTVGIALFGYLFWRYKDYLQGKLAVPLYLIILFQLILTFLQVTDIPFRYLNETQKAPYVRMWVAELFNSFIFLTVSRILFRIKAAHIYLKNKGAPSFKIVQDKERAHCMECFQYLFFIGYGIITSILLIAWVEKHDMGRHF